MAATQRFVFLVLDGVGVGALPDAADYGDTGSDTLGNLGRIAGFHLPNFQRLGLGNIAPIHGLLPTEIPSCLPGRLAPQSAGKDTTVGHWEHMGLITSRPFPTYPDGFPEDVVAPFRRAVGRDILGNVPASGTEVIASLGAEHLRTGRPIVYTSADSVFQIAAHLDVVPLAQLYDWCVIARGLLQGPHAVARVIARPFAGVQGAFVRTKDRRDFSLEPQGPTYLDALMEKRVPILALGKVAEIFAGRGVSATVKVVSNKDNLALVIDLLRGRSREGRFDEGLLFTNLVDFDMTWGHRNDADGFARGLETVDAALPYLLAALRPEDRLIITADHGVDPTTPSTDHSREYVPLLLYPRPPDAPQSSYEGSFADTGATVFSYLTGERPPLAGRAITDLQPGRGWRRYTPVVPVLGAESSRIPGRLGAAEAEEAGRWLADRLGPAPDVAVILGSGLRPDPLPEILDEVSYHEIPCWPAGSIIGHSYRLSLVRWLGWRVVLLQGRIHEYEGFDLSEVQQAVRTLGAWGTRRLILTSASGAVSTDLAPGEVAAVGEVLDLHRLDPEGYPVRLHASAEGLLDALRRPGRLHASVSGPQYETPAELAVLRAMGAHTVSMSPAGELRAAHDEQMESAVLTAVANAGDTSHEEVLAGTARAGGALGATIEAILRAWGAPSA